LFRIDLYCVSLYEKLELYEHALKVVTELLALRLDPVAIRSLFRMCRITKNYDKVDELLSKEPSIIKANEFNVLYELVYYFEAKNDFDQLQKVLRTIDKRFATNLPVLRTLRNFYIRFGMLEDARRLEPAILKLFPRDDRISGRFIKEVAESEAELASKVQDLYSELEHQKQLAAISDLTMGISHELGQPITNIRYTIQFYKKLFDKKLTKENVINVFDSVLEETERMGALINGLAPLTSSKSVTEQVDLVDRIKKRVNAENLRLREQRISVSIAPQKAVFIQSDPVRVDQLVPGGHFKFPQWRGQERVDCYSGSGVLAMTLLFK
jgi:signal transduction histidine kinase